MSNDNVYFFTQARWAGAFDSDLPVPRSPTARDKKDLVRKRFLSTKVPKKRLKAVLFGCGAWERGSLVPILYNNDYEMIFAHPDQRGVDLVNGTHGYKVTEMDHPQGLMGRSINIYNYRALNLVTQEEEIIREIYNADLVTYFDNRYLVDLVAPLIATAIASRHQENSVLQIDVIGYARDIVEPRNKILGQKIYDWLRLAFDDESAARAMKGVRVFRSILDRMIPRDSGCTGLDVNVETFNEWFIDTSEDELHHGIKLTTHRNVPFKTRLKRQRWALDLGLLLTAYWAHYLKLSYIHLAIQNPQVETSVRRALAETSDLLIGKYNGNVIDSKRHVNKVVARLKNPALKYTSVFVGEGPKSRYLAILAQPLRESYSQGRANGILKCVEMLFHYQDVIGDEESQRLGALMRDPGVSPSEIREEFTGVKADQKNLAQRLNELIENARSDMQQRSGRNFAARPDFRGGAPSGERGGPASGATWGNKATPAPAAAGGRGGGGGGGGGGGAGRGTDIEYRLRCATPSGASAASSGSRGSTAGTGRGSERRDKSRAGWKP